MDISHLIEALQDPAAYPEPAPVEVRQTHLSAVFLVGGYVYKLKKPVSLGFVDFTTPEKRLHACREEVRLNRRLAPEVYLGVVPVARVAGRLCVEQEGEVVEHVVKMLRLPDEATLKSRLLRGEVTADLLDRLARLLVRFHAEAEAGPHVAAAGRLEVVARNARENFTQSAGHVGVTVTAEVHARAHRALEEAIARLGDLIERRAGQGIPRDTHGDLHLSHVYWFPDQPEEKQLVILDCVEFSERLRHADPVADMAFLVMDLLYHGRPDLARAFTEAYFRSRDDEAGPALVPFYTAYRAAVRAKVQGMKAAMAEVPPEEREQARRRARAYWLLCLAQLEPPGRRPFLALVAGLPGTGKSTLARALADRAGFHWVRSDAVRKQLAGLAPEDPGSAGGEDLYTPAWNERTYQECLRQAEALLLQGERVVVDATFRAEGPRQAFLQMARDLAVGALLLQCQVSPETARRRLEARRGDASDAGVAVYDQLSGRWEEPGPLTRQHLQPISTEGRPEEVSAGALAALRGAGA